MQFDPTFEPTAVGGFKYPPSFVSMFDEFTAFLRTDGFLREYADARLLLYSSDIAMASERMPAALLPFMCDEQASWPDYYAFDIKHDVLEFPVVVWSDHAVVMDWPSFPVFFQWLREFIVKHDHPA